MFDTANKVNKSSKIEEDAKLPISSASIKTNSISIAENIQNNWQYKSIKYYIDQYDRDNFEIIKNTNSKDLDTILTNNISITPPENQGTYSNMIIDEINNIKKSNVYHELPILPYGKSLSDLEFIGLFKSCVKYANYVLDSDSLENTKNRLLELTDDIINIFACPQILKDLKENALLSILTSIKADDQTDNFKLLNVQYSSLSPLIKMQFGKYELDKKELTEIFCSPVYVKNYMMALAKFIPDFSQKIPTEEKLKEYIRNHFKNHDIYFCDIADQDNILALTIHTANMYMKARYLEEYYKQKNEMNLIIIREKIILNIAHELNHVLVREINLEMKSNFFIKSFYIDKREDDKIYFVSKFDLDTHDLSIDESGNVFDFFFYNQYYFDDLYEQEADLFLNIKEINTLEEYKQKLNNIIDGEKVKKPKFNPVNKFKKLDNGPGRCIRSRILGKNSKKTKTDGGKNGQ